MSNKRYRKPAPKVADLSDPLRDEKGEEIAIDLAHPRTFFGEECARLLFYREPELDDFVKADGLGEFGTLRVLIAGCCGITVKEAGSLHFVDLKAAGRVIKSFLGTNEIVPGEGQGQGGDDESDESHDEAPAAD